MKGVQYVVDEHGKPTSVVIDLGIWSELWEDIYDAMLAECNTGEETVSWDTVKAEIQNELQENMQEHAV